MKWNKAPLLLLLPLLISACDSQQPSYSASNTTSVQPAAQAAPPAPPPPAVAEPAEPAATPVAEQRPAETSKSYGSAAAPRVAIPGGSLPRNEALAPVKPIGIGGCDSYIERYRACVNNSATNRTTRFALVHVFNQQVRKWQADVASGETTGLVAACAEADRQARDQLVKAGCTSF